MTLRDHLGPRTPENAALHDELDRLLAARAVAAKAILEDWNALEILVNHQLRHSASASIKTRSMRLAQIKSGLREVALATTDSTAALDRVIRAHVEKALKYAAGCAQQEATNCNEVGDRNGMRACERIANCLLTDSTADDVLREMGGRGC